MKANRKPHVAALIPVQSYTAVFTVSNGDTITSTVAASDEMEAVKAVRKYLAFETLKSITHAGSVYVEPASFAKWV